MNLLVKVCGMTDGENIRRVEELGVDFIGFVFYPRSPRFVYQMPDYLPRRARRIGVFVNETKETVLTYADRFELDYVQLHGKESPLYCQSLRKSHGLKVIKAFHLPPRATWPPQKPTTAPATTSSSRARRPSWAARDGSSTGACSTATPAAHRSS